MELLFLEALEKKSDAGDPRSFRCCCCLGVFFWLIFSTAKIGGEEFVGFFLGGVDECW